MKRMMVLIALTLLSACGSQETTKSTPVATPKEEMREQLSEPEAPAQMRNFAPLKIGDYDVQPMFEEEIEDGHYNIDITGGEVAAVRIWVGDEAATDAMVARTEIENNYHHGHVELPDPIPADAALWIEIETPSGEKLKGSTPLAAS